MNDHVDASAGEPDTSANTPPPIPPVVDIPPDQSRPNSEERNKPDKISKSDKIMLWATGFIALGTLVSAGAICFQWWEIHKGGADTTTIADASKRNADAADKFASSAGGINTKIGEAVTKLGQQIDDSEAFLRADERAWVEINSIEKVATYPPEGTFSTLFKYNIFLKNSGKTVARDVRFHVENVDASDGFDDNLKGIYMSQDQTFREMGTGNRAITPDQPGPQTIAPGVISTAPMQSGGQEPKRYGGRYRYTFILGRIDYTDAFDTPHWVHFCFLVEDAKGDLVHCRYGNNEDHNLEKKSLPR